jgi:hypothetical protein
MEHGLHMPPQDAVLLSSRHSLTHMWKPERHLNPQVFPSQVASAFGGGEQGSHLLVPQLLVLVFVTQLPSHACLPGGQVPSQARPAGRHAPVAMHSVVPAGHSALHCPF